MINGQRVLVVDGMHEIQEVLHAVLAPRGLRVDWVRSHVQQHPGAQSDEPAIVVIDAEAIPVSPEQSRARWARVPQVIIGAEETESQADVDTQHTYLSKPFLFPDLIQAIEDLLPAP